MPSLRDATRTAGYAYADAYGAGFKYADGMIANNDLSPYDPRFRLIRGSYTDDTGCE